MAENAEYAAALAAVQAECVVIERTKTAHVVTKSGATYEYDYADLGLVAQSVLPLLGRHGLAFETQLVREQREMVLRARLLHSSGEGSEWSEWPLGEMKDPQSMGSQITYARRYTLLTLTGMHPMGEDDDGEKAGKPQYSGQREAAEANSSPTQKPKPSPLADVIAMGRAAQVSDEQIRLDLEAVAGGRPHGKLTTDELRQLWTTYRDTAKAIAEDAARVADAQENDHAPGRSVTTVLLPEGDVPSAKNVGAVEDQTEDPWQVAGTPLSELEGRDGRDDDAGDQRGEADAGTDGADDGGSEGGGAEGADRPGD